MRVVRIWEHVPADMAGDIVEAELLHSPRVQPLLTECGRLHRSCQVKHSYTQELPPATDLLLEWKNRPTRSAARGGKHLGDGQFTRTVPAGRRSSEERPAAVVVRAELGEAIERWPTRGWGLGLSPQRSPRRSGAASRCRCRCSCGKTATRFRREPQSQAI